MSRVKENFKKVDFAPPIDSCLSPGPVSEKANEMV